MRIIVIGGAGFLGSGFTQFCVSKGHEVFALDIQPNPALDPSVEFECVDILNKNELSECFKRISKIAGPINGVISFASIDYKINSEEEIKDSNSIDPAPPADFNLSINGSLNIYEAAIAAFKPDGLSLVYVGSDLSVIAPYQPLYREYIHPGASKPIAYSTVKHAMVGLIRYLATFNPGLGVRCNLLCPSGIDNGSMPDDFRLGLSKLNPMMRLSTMDEVFGPALFLLSGDSGFINGHMLVIDGGRSVW